MRKKRKRRRRGVDRGGGGSDQFQSSKRPLPLLLPLLRSPALHQGQRKSSGAVCRGCTSAPLSTSSCTPAPRDTYTSIHQFIQQFVKNSLSLENCQIEVKLFKLKAGILVVYTHSFQTRLLFCGSVPASAHAHCLKNQLCDLKHAHSIWTIHSDLVQ